jgi:hypothetical protein
MTKRLGSVNKRIAPEAQVVAPRLVRKRSRSGDRRLDKTWYSLPNDVLYSIGNVLEQTDSRKKTQESDAWT